MVALTGYTFLRTLFKSTIYKKTQSPNIESADDQQQKLILNFNILLILKDS